MFSLQLTEGFNIRYPHLYKYGYNYFVFNGGEPHIQFNKNHSDAKIEIVTRLKSSEDVIKLLMAVDALRRQGVEYITLFVPYFPGARQDRVMVPGEPLSVKVYADLINNLKLDKVTIFDPHSDVTPALLNNCEIINNHEFIYKCIVDSKIKNFNLISPDAGANKKIKDLAKHIWPATPMSEIIKCDKTRNVANGNITGFEVYSDDLKGRNCVIVDDICDGGGTFIGLAEELKKKGAGDLYLIVSHGIFSKGFKELKKHFKAIYTTDSWVNDYAMEIPEIEKGSEIVNIMYFKDFL